MTPISLAAQKTLDRLAALAREAGGATRLDNRPGTYMPLCVEWIAADQLSLAHYGESNGDAMRDPDMVFWYGPDRRWYPVNYRNDWTGTDRPAIEFGDAGRPRRSPEHDEAAGDTAPTPGFGGCRAGDVVGDDHRLAGEPLGTQARLCLVEVEHVACVVPVRQQDPAAHLGADSHVVHLAA